MLIIETNRTQEREDIDATMVMKICEWSMMFATTRFVANVTVVKKWRRRK
jgi:hypothetical protein